MVTSENPPESALRSAHPGSITEGAILLLLISDRVGGHEGLWKGTRVGGGGTICEEDRGVERTLFGKSQSFDRNLPLPPPSPICFGEM